MARLSTTNYDKILAGWSRLPLNSGVRFHGGSTTKYSLEGAGGRVTMINNAAWRITDGGLVEQSEYGVAKPMELQGCAMHPTKKFVVANNIDLAETATWNGGAGLWPVGDTNTPFSGTFDGQGHVLSGVHIDRPYLDYAALFGRIAGSGAVVTNLGVTGSVSGGDYVGGFFGEIEGGAVVADCYARVSVTSSGDGCHRGGFGGRNDQSTIRRAYSTGTVSPAVGINGGGLVGTADTSGAYEDDGNFWDKDTSGWDTSAMGAGRTTLQMKEIGNYAAAGWDIASCKERLNDGYPVLNAEAVEGAPVWYLFSSGGSLIMIR